MGETERYKFANTEQFLELYKDSTSRNRSPSKDLIDKLDPKGVHVAGFQMKHNGIEWRVLWMCKLKDEEEPFEIWMDNGLKEFDENTNSSADALSILDQMRD